MANAIETPVYVCLDCARAHALEKPLALLTPQPGKCDLCGRCTLVVEPDEPVSVLDSWKGA